MTNPTTRASLLEHTRHEPVFVLGFTRSGTSLLCRLLLDHLGVNFGTESQFIARVHRHLHQYGDLTRDASLRRLFEDLSRERFFARTRQNFGFVLDIDRAMREIPARTYAGALDAIFGQFAAAKGFSRWGDKTPEYNYHLPLLDALFPRAQYVHIVRDGRDTAASLRATSFGAKTALEAARDWCNGLDRIQRFGRRLSADRYLEIRYEALIADPVGTMRTVASFLGMTDPNGAVDAAAGRLRDQVRGNNASKWRQGSLAPRELECFEAIAGRHLSALGYERAVASPRPVGPFESVAWRMVGIRRRLANPQYWADNVYRLSLRLRHAGIPMPTARP